MWLGDNKYPLCSQECAEAWGEDNMDAEWDENVYVQCGGFIDYGYDTEPNAICCWCDKPVPLNTEEAQDARDAALEAIGDEQRDERGGK